MDEELDVLPLLNTVAYPSAVTPLAVATPAALRLLDRFDGAPQRLFITALRHPTRRPDEPTFDDCYAIGTLALVHRLLRLPDGTLRVALEGLERAMMVDLLPGPNLRARISLLPDYPADAQAAAAALQTLLLDHAPLPQVSAEWYAEIAAEDDPARLSFLVAGPLLARAPLADRQRFLELRDPGARMMLLLDQLADLPSPAIVHALAPESIASPTSLQVGRAHWLRWTPQGFVLTPFLAAVLPGYGRVQISGRLSSAALTRVQVAVDAVRAGYQRYGLSLRRMRTHDLHLHVAETIDDDNQSGCGGAAALAALSAFTQQALRSDALLLADLDLHGYLHPIRQLSERLLSAEQAGITTVVIAPGRTPPVMERLHIHIAPDLHAALPYLWYAPQEREVTQN